MGPHRAEADLAEFSGEPLLQDSDRPDLDDAKIRTQADAQLVDQLSRLEKELVEVRSKARKTVFDKIVTRTLAIAFAVSTVAFAGLYGTEMGTNNNLKAQQQRTLRKVKETMDELNRTKQDLGKTKQEKKKVTGERDKAKHGRDKAIGERNTARGEVKLYSDFVGRANMCAPIKDRNKTIECRNKAARLFHKEYKQRKR